MKLKHWIVFLALVIGLPLVGYYGDYQNLYSPYIVNITSLDQMPDQPFSWVASLILAAFFVILLGLALYRILTHLRPIRRGTLPWWGWVALLLVGVCWFIAWFRPHAVGIYKPLNFTVLWLSYIVLMNAFAYSQSGTCYLISQPLTLVKLFICSIPFWWYFEYLNRFVFNWYYFVGGGFEASDYLIFGSIAFGTVLPAVMSTRQFLLSLSTIREGFSNLPKLRTKYPKLVAAIFLTLACLTLILISVYPDYLYPFLWISPLFVLVGLQTFWGESHIFYPVAKGNYTPLVTSMLAAFLCGFFWEIWNFYSLPKWVYSVPYVGGFKLFEMPLLGYLGYVPFGLECQAIAEMILHNKSRVS